MKWLLQQQSTTITLSLSLSLSSVDVFSIDCMSDIMIIDIHAVRMLHRLDINEHRDCQQESNPGKTDVLHDNVCALLA